MIDEPKPDSLILRDGQQLDLIPSDQLGGALFHDFEKKGEFTGARLFAQDEQRYLTVIHLLAEGLGPARIGKLLQVSPNTVRAIRDREHDSIDQVKKQVATRCLHGAEMCTDGILERLDDEESRKKVSLKDLAIVAGVLAEKHQLLTGGATSRTEFVPAARPTHDDFNRMLDDAVDITAAVVDETGRPGGETEQKRLTGASGTAIAPGVKQPAPGNPTRPDPVLPSAPADAVSGAQEPESPANEEVESP